MTKRKRKALSFLLVDIWLNWFYSFDIFSSSICIIDKTERINRKTTNVQKKTNNRQMFFTRIRFSLSFSPKKSVENVAFFGRDQLSLVGTVLSVFSSVFSSSSSLRKWKSRIHTHTHTELLHHWERYQRQWLLSKTPKFSSEIKLNYHMSLFLKKNFCFSFFSSYSSWSLFFLVRIFLIWFD